MSLSTPQHVSGSTGCTPFFILHLPATGTRVSSKESFASQAESRPRVCELRGTVEEPAATTNGFKAPWVFVHQHPHKSAAAGHRALKLQDL